jgi:hypothetical protein
MRHLILLLTSLLAACATTGSGGGIITIETSSNGQVLPGANCVVNTFNNSWQVTTPVTINVGGATGDLHIVCDKEGYRTSEMIFHPSPSFVPNVGIGVGGGSGNIGVGLGFGVPVALGSSGYPSRVMVNLNPL